MTMNEIESRVDVLSEIIALSTHANTKNIIITAMELDGPFDQQAGEEAFRRASLRFPQFMSRLRETRVWGRHYLAWEHRPDVPLPLTITLLPKCESSNPGLDDIMTVLRPSLDRDWDLFNEVAVRYYILRYGDQHTVAACACHHVAGDGGTAAEFGKELLRCYHEIVSGQKADWADEGHGITSSRKRAIIPRPNGWKEAIVNSHQGFMRIFEKATHPVGSGKPNDAREHFAKRVLSHEDSVKAVTWASRSRVSFVDALTACSNLAIDEWNETRGLTPGILTTAMTVNTRGRFTGFETPNNSSVIFFRSLPHERRDGPGLARALARMRMRHFREQKDLAATHNVRRLAQCLRYFPLFLRRRLVHFMLERHRFSIAVTFLGAVWPKIVNGKPSADSSITIAADLTVSEVHGLGYKLHSGTRLILIGYAFRERLNLILAGSGSLFTRDETEAFLDLVVGKLLTPPQAST